MVGKASTGFAVACFLSAGLVSTSARANENTQDQENVSASAGTLATAGTLEQASSGTVAVGPHPTIMATVASPTGEATSDPSEDINPGLYNAHGVGFRSGINVVPTWILSQFLATHTNSLCRKEIGEFAGDRGITRQEGCNFYIGGEYIYRKSRNLDIVASVGYQKLGVPDGLWLDKDEWGDSCTTHDGGDCNLAAADYTEIDLGLVFIQADFIGRVPIVRTSDVEFSIGGGGGFGLGIIVGDGVHQTPLGSASSDAGSCTTLEDFADFTRCTPTWFDDPDIDQDGDGNRVADVAPSDADQVADCSADDCSVASLDAMGSRSEQADVPPVIPVINVVASARLIVKDALGITVSGGFNTGFYFGGGLSYMFGGGGK